jgi:hypothetical protein
MANDETESLNPKLILSNFSSIVLTSWKREFVERMQN